MSPRWAEVAGHTLWFYYREEHQRPHVAVRGEHHATIDLNTLEILAGGLPPNVYRAVRRFLAHHRDEAFAAWEASRRGEPPGTIPGGR
ncbi:MAG TPA: DUF4160 domain-containing protein [Nitriliruptorales bacterium]